MGFHFTFETNENPQTDFKCIHLEFMIYEFLPSHYFHSDYQSLPSIDIIFAKETVLGTVGTQRYKTQALCL